MNILIAGRLGRYADRILALKRAGHSLVYCTMAAPQQKPLPDNLKDPSIMMYTALRGEAGKLVDWITRTHEIDVIYSMKNVWDGSLELLEEILDAAINVPIVRHTKEHFCRPSRIEDRSLRETSGQIYINEESLEYFRKTYGARLDTAHILDTDYLPARYLEGELSSKIRKATGTPQLLMAGGLANNGGRSDLRSLCRELTGYGVQVHLYGRKFVGVNQDGILGVDHTESRREYELLEMEGFCRLHDHIEPESYVASWSGYDVGLMHRACTPDIDAFAYFNYPNRLGPYLACGLPIAQEMGSHRAMERLIQRQGIGILYRSHRELADMLKDESLLEEVSAEVRKRRFEYTFEHHVPALITILSTYSRRGTAEPQSTTQPES